MFFDNSPEKQRLWITFSIFCGILFIMVIAAERAWEHRPATSQVISPSQATSDDALVPPLARDLSHTTAPQEPLL